MRTEALAMAIPDFQTLMVPTLRVSATGEVKISDAVGRLADEFALTEAERAELLPSGRQTIFANRVLWARFYLGKAGLVEATRRAHFQITDRGHQVLASRPKRIDIRFLSKFPEFKAFRGAGSTAGKSAAEDAVGVTGMTPDEIIRRAHEQLEDELGGELLARILNAPAEFFERLIVQRPTSHLYGVRRVHG
jgi:restriction system protein